MKYCSKCGAELLDEAVICPKCGCIADQSAFNKTRKEAVKNDPDASPKSRLVYLLLCFFAGALGIHRFYAGKTGTGVLYIFTFGLFGIGVLIDLIMAVCGSATDAEGKYITNWDID